MKRIIIFVIMALPLYLSAQEAQMNASSPGTGSESILVTSPGNGDVFMREVTVKGRAGNAIGQVEVINRSAAQTNIVDVIDGVWVANLPLNIAQTNRLLVNGLALKSRIILTTKKIWVVSQLDFSLSGKIFMVIIWALIIALNVFAFANIFKIRKDKIVEPLEIDTQDD